MDNKLHSDDIKELAGALCKVQGSIGKAITNKHNPFFKSNYADLAECISVAQEALLENGCCVTHSILTHEGRDVMHTMLIHTSGQWIKCIFDIGTSSKDKPQAKGSAITYARRYTFCSLVGIAQQDDDGNAASNPPPKQQVVKKVETMEDIFERLKTAVMEVETTEGLAKIMDHPQRVNWSLNAGFKHQNLYDEFEQIVLNKKEELANQE